LFISLSLKQLNLLLAKSSGGKTALHYCVENNQTAIAELLIDRLNELTATSNDCQATTSTASVFQTVYASESSRSFIDAKDTEGLTALAHAIVAGNRLMVECLLRRGADVTGCDFEGHTVVHFATGLSMDVRKFTM